MKTWNIAANRCAVILASIAVVMTGCGSSDSSPGGTDGGANDSCASVNCNDGGNSAGSCGSSACGGDITGTWKVTSSCLEMDVGAMGKYFGCSQSIDAKTSKIDYSGTVTYNADKSFRQTISMTMVTETVIPEQCLTKNGFQITCQTIQDRLPSTMKALTKCVAAGGGCKCEYGPIKAADSLVETGTYSIQGNTITTTGTGSSDYDYCVKGNQLTLTPKYKSSSNSVSEGISGNIVYAKQ